jgi:hypothetical protein
MIVSVVVDDDNPGGLRAADADADFEAIGLPTGSATCSLRV